MALAFSFIEIFPTFCCARLFGLNGHPSLNPNGPTESGWKKCPYAFKNPPAWILSPLAGKWRPMAEICPSPGPQACSWFPAGSSAVATGVGHILSSQGGQHRTSQAQSAHSMNKMPICPGLPGCLLAPKIKISRPHTLSGLDLRPGSGTIFFGWWPRGRRSSRAGGSRCPRRGRRG